MTDINIEERDGLIIIHIFGSLTVNNISKIEEEWNRLLDKMPQVLAINCIDLRHIDSLGISHLLKLSHNTSRRDIELVLYGLNESVDKLFQIADLDKLFQILTKEEFENNY